MITQYFDISLYICNAEKAKVLYHTSAKAKFLQRGLAAAGATLEINNGRLQQS